MGRWVKRMAIDPESFIGVSPETVYVPDEGETPEEARREELRREELRRDIADLEARKGRVEKAIEAHEQNARLHTEEANRGHARNRQLSVELARLHRELRGPDSSPLDEGDGAR